MNSLASIWIGFSLLASQTAYASEPSSLCFDFKNPVKQPMIKPIKSGGKKDSTAGEKFSDEHLGEWGAARGVVEKSVYEVYQAILDPFTIKDPDKAQVTLTQENRNGFNAFQIREIKISPFPLINIEWIEQWAFVITKGKDLDPREMVISYQKSEGTSHIKSLCGSIVLKQIGKQKTDVFLYEQMKAARRNFKDIIDGHLGTLRTLRKVRSVPVPSPARSGNPH